MVPFGFACCVRSARCFSVCSLLCFALWHASAVGFVFNCIRAAGCSALLFAVGRATCRGLCTCVVAVLRWFVCCVRWLYCLQRLLLLPLYAASCAACPLSYCFCLCVFLCCACCSLCTAYVLLASLCLRICTFYVCDWIGLLYAASLLRPMYASYALCYNFAFLPGACCVRCMLLC